MECQGFYGPCSEDVVYASYLMPDLSDAGCCWLCSNCIQILKNYGAEIFGVKVSS